MPNTEPGALAQWGPLGSSKLRRNLGRSIRLEAAGGKTRAEVLVFTGADSSDNNALAIGDSLASSCTVTLAILQQNVGVDEPVAVIEGTIEWGTDGTSAQARFDWLNGGVLVAAASSFKVTAEILSIPPGRSVEVAAFIGYYTVAGVAARLTRIAAAGGSLIPIAQMAQTVVPLTDDANGVTLQFTADQNGALPLFGLHTIAAGLPPQGIQIPPGAAAVIATPVGPGPVPIMFQLSI